MTSSKALKVCLPASAKDLPLAPPFSMRGTLAIKLVLSTGGSCAKSPIKRTPMPPNGPMSSG
eukprot:11222674-Lingulodinium_polyedra.AAC.1